MAIFRMYTGPDNKSHWEEQTLAEHPTLTKPQAAAHIIFNQQPAGKFLDWHPAPRRQYVIVISGQLEIGFGDGTVRRFGPGDARIGRGHHRPRTYDTVCWSGDGGNCDD